MHIVDKCQGTSALATSLDRRMNPHTLARTHTHTRTNWRVSPYNAPAPPIDNEKCWTGSYSGYNKTRYSDTITILFNIIIINYNKEYAFLSY